MLQIFFVIFLYFQLKNIHYIYQIFASVLFIEFSFV